MDKLLSSTGSDLTARTGRFNLVSGAVTMLMGIASSLSVATSGFIFRLAGHSLAFVIFASACRSGHDFSVVTAPRNQARKLLRG